MGELILLSPPEPAAEPELSQKTEPISGQARSCSLRMGCYLAIFLLKQSIGNIY